MSASIPAVLRTLATLLSGHRMTQLPPLLLTILAATKRTRMQEEARKFTADRSTMIFRCSVTILLKGSSMTTAPVVSKRPCRTTLVMPPARFSVEMSMQHLSVGPSAPAGAVIAVFPPRRNAETGRAQKISERFISAGTRPFGRWLPMIGGSRFLFRSAIPIAGRPPSGPPRSMLECHSGIDRNSAVTDNRPMGAGPRILVVDDNDDNRYTLKLHLDLEGYTNVETARDGEEAIALLETSAFDLVLLDVMMPKVDGFQVLTWLKDQARLRDLPVIMISALTEMNSMARCIELGAVDYLLKPFNPVLLKARLGPTLAKKRLGGEVDAHLARLQEELDAARRLQMAMVPQSFPAPSPDFPIDLCASMEPARRSAAISTIFSSPRTACCVSWSATCRAR